MSKLNIKKLAQEIYDSLKDKEGEEFLDVSRKVVHRMKDMRMLSKADSIFGEIGKISDLEHNLIRAEVTSSVKLSKKIVTEIEDEIKRRYKVKEVILSLHDDPKILGGFKIRVRDEIIDSTLLNKISQLQEYLLKN